MADNVFESSDSGRSMKPLAHAQSVTFDTPMQLERGDTLCEVTVAYETYGELNASSSNAVLICHALSGDSHVASHDDNDDAGWWDIVVGSGKAIDTDKFFVICPNVLGGCRGTTGPNSTNPATGEHYGCDFPTITVGDMVEVQLRLVEHFGIDTLLAVIGGSMGGLQVLQWAACHGDRARGIIPVATSPHLSSQAMAFDIVGRNAILRDPDFCDGQYYDKGRGPSVGLAIARMIGHITYLSRESMQQKFDANRHAPRDVPVEFEKKFSVGSYLGYKGAEFVERFDANSYIVLSMAMDLFSLGQSVDELIEVFKDNPCRWMLMSFTSDWLFSSAELQLVTDALLKSDKSVSYCNIKSAAGHDAFLLQDELKSYGSLIEAFLANISDSPGGCNCGDDRPRNDPTSIFHSADPQRLDYDRIVDLIVPGASVLDLGCGNGGLLRQLADKGHERLMGIEISEEEVIEGVRCGLDVIHSDLNDGLTPFGDKQFDCVVLSRTMQAVKDVERVVDDMLRVGKRCIVSFPNFGYHKLRDMLYKDGRAPEASGVLKHKWYDSPNIRFFTIADFEEFCCDRGILIHELVALDTETGSRVNNDPNLTADLAIFVISRN